MWGVLRGSPRSTRRHSRRRSARLLRVIARALTLAAAEGRVALVAHGHILRSLAGCWLGLGATGGRLLVLGTAGISVLGQEREQRAVLRWNSSAVL